MVEIPANHPFVQIEGNSNKQDDTNEETYHTNRAYFLAFDFAFNSFFNDFKSSGTNTSSVSTLSTFIRFTTSPKRSVSNLGKISRSRWKTRPSHLQ